MSPKEEDKETLSLWLLLVRNGGKEGVHVLEAAQAGPLHMLWSSLLVPAELRVSCSGPFSRNSTLSCVPAQRQDAGCRRDRSFLGTYNVCPPFEEGARPRSFHTLQMPVAATAFVTRGEAGKRRAL